MRTKMETYPVPAEAWDEVVEEVCRHVRLNREVAKSVHGRMKMERICHADLRAWVLPALAESGTLPEPGRLEVRWHCSTAIARNIWSNYAGWWDDALGEPPPFPERVRQRRPEQVADAPITTGPHVYVVEAVGVGLVKIGFTGASVRDRVLSLQTGSPVPLRCVACFPAPVGVEALLHERHDAVRKHGEWFEWTPFLDHDVQRLTGGVRRLDEARALLGDR